jgi:uncharacterized protein (DUF427 family)
MWKFNGSSRPDFAAAPGPGQESVWDYPRPPALRRDNRLVEVRDGHFVIARTTASFRACETASPPTFYIPPADVALDRLVPVAGSSVCEWKGAAAYLALAGAPDMPVAWRYPRPRPRFDAIRDYVAFYPGRIACFVAGERALPQPGRFYGGWITADVAGPFKGEPGTGHW